MTSPTYATVLTQMTDWLGTWIGLWQNKIPAGTRGTAIWYNEDRVIMSGRFSLRRVRPPDTYKPGSPGYYMHALYIRSKAACKSDHPHLRRLWRIRDKWLNERPGEIPPGAKQTQQTGRHCPPYVTRGKARSKVGRKLYKKGYDGQYPRDCKNKSYIYALVNMTNGMIYVGRTNRSPYRRFHEHFISDDFIGRTVRSYAYKFVVVVLETIPTHVMGMPPNKFPHVSARENSWIHRLDTVNHGYNSRCEISAPPPPVLPTHGFNVRPIRRSRHPQRISGNLSAQGSNAAFKSSGSRQYRSRDWQRRWQFLLKLAKRCDVSVQKYVDKLSSKNVGSLLKYLMSTIRVAPEHRFYFNRLRAKFLDSFPYVCGHANQEAS